MHILIVEDEKGIASFLQQGLEEEGYTVWVANDGQLGLNLAFSNPPDLILLDWLLPKMQGIDVCKAIREKDTTTPILFLTAKDTIQETIEGLKAGANDYIKKPFSFEELLLRIKVHLHDKEVNTDYYLNSIKINDLTHQVFKDNEIELTGFKFLPTEKEYSNLS